MQSAFSWDLNEHERFCIEVDECNILGAVLPSKIPTETRSVL